MRPVFTIVKWREGYQIEDVEAFLDDVEPRLARNSGEELADEIDRIRFTPVRLRPGYDMREVDDYLASLANQARRT